MLNGGLINRCNIALMFVRLKLTCSDHVKARFSTTCAGGQLARSWTQPVCSVKRCARALQSWEGCKVMEGRKRHLILLIHACYGLSPVLDPLVTFLLGGIDLEIRLRAAIARRKGAHCRARGT